MPDEHERFVEALEKYGCDWSQVTAHVGTRRKQQIRSHAQRTFEKWRKQGLEELIPPRRVVSRRKVVPDKVASPEPPAMAPRSRDQDWDSVFNLPEGNLLSGAESLPTSSCRFLPLPCPPHLSRVPPSPFKLPVLPANQPLDCPYIMSLPEFDESSFQEEEEEETNSLNTSQPTTPTSLNTNTDEEDAAPSVSASSSPPDSEWWLSLLASH